MLMLGLPIAFMAIFGFAFGHSSETTLKVGVVNDDQGPLGSAYASALGNLTYQDGKALVAARAYATVDDARADLKARSIDLVVHVPATFSRDLTPQTTTGASSV